MDISVETLNKITDRLTDLAAHIHALQAILVEKGITTEGQYGEVLEKWRTFVANQPAELAWKEALRALPDGGKR